MGIHKAMAAIFSQSRPISSFLSGDYLLLISKSQSLLECIEIWESSQMFPLLMSGFRGVISMLVTALPRDTFHSFLCKRQLNNPDRSSSFASATEATKGSRGGKPGGSVQC